MHILSDRRLQWMLTLIILLPMLIYGSAVVQNSFVSIDDTLLITSNGAVQSFTLRNIWHVFSSYDPELYIPLTLFSYQIEWALSGGSPVLFHLTNLLLHIGSSVLLFLLLRKVFRSDLFALAAALLFAIHPLQSEAVLWAAARKDVLSSFFLFLSALLYELSRQERRDDFQYWSIGVFFLALMSKVTVLTLPLILLLLDWNRGEKMTLKRVMQKWPYFLLSVVFAVIAAIGKTRNLAELTSFQYVLISGKSTIFYLTKMFLPVNLSIAYPQTTPVTLTSPEFYIPLVLAIALGLLALAMIRIHRGVAFGLLFFFLTLPVNFFNVWKNGFVFFASDRYAYIPAIGIFVAVLAALQWINRKAPLAILCSVIPLLALTSFVHAKTWRNSETLYKQGLFTYPLSPLLIVNLGDEYVKQGKEDEGLLEFQKVIAIDPKHIVALTNAGNLFKKRGDLVEAEKLYRQATESVSDQPFVEHLIGFYLLGELLIEKGQTDEGLAILREATERGSQFAEAFYNLGIMLQKQMQATEAITAFERAVALDDAYLPARYHLAGLYAERGRLPEAAAQLEAIITIDPGYEKSQEHLVNIRNLLKN